MTKPTGNLLADTETFLRAAEHPIPDVPAVPSRDVLALRLSLLLEEVVELFDACGLDRFDIQDVVVEPKEERTQRIAGRLQVVHALGKRADLPEMVDAYHDITVIAHGGALESAGPATIDTGNEVARANLDKIVDGRVLRREDNKILKPEGHRGADVESELRKHGWSG